MLLFDILEVLVTAIQDNCRMIRANQLVSYYMWYTSTLYNSSAFQFRLNSNHPNNSLLACITKRRAGVVRKSLEFLFQFGLKNGMIIVKPRAMDILDAIRSANEGIACEQTHTYLNAGILRCEPE